MTTGTQPLDPGRLTVKPTARAVTAAFALLVLVPASAVRAEGSTEIGVLRCDAVPGSRVNLIVRSTVDVKCVFKGGNVEERYRGETGITLGLDLSFRKDERFAFTVLAATTDTPGGYALAGKYLGGKAVASLGVGLGAAALVGGSNNHFGLQPLALESNQGVGVAAGIGFLYIEPDN